MVEGLPAVVSDNLKETSGSLLLNEDLLERLLVSKSFKREKQLRKFVFPEPLLPSKKAVFKIFVPSTDVHQSLSVRVPLGFSLVALKLNSVRSLNERKLVNAMDSIIFASFGIQSYTKKPYIPIICVK